MSRELHWDDRYCPNGHTWIFCPASTLYQDFYYCEEEDKFWEPTVKPLKVETIAKEYNGHRPNQMVMYALSEQAIKNIRNTRNFEEIIALEQQLSNHKLVKEKKNG